MPAALAPPLTALRWFTLAVGLALSARRIAEGDTSIIVWGAALLAYAVLRTIRPITGTVSLTAFAEVLAEVALHVLAVAATGYWASPYVLVLVNAVVVGGFARGFGFALRLAIVSAAAVGVPYVVNAPANSGALEDGLAWSTVLFLVAVIAGYSNRLYGSAAAQQIEAQGQVLQLRHANELLLSLNRLARTLPSSLDEGQVLESTMERLRGLVDADALALLLRDDADSARFNVVAVEGAKLAPALALGSMPAPAQVAVAGERAQLVADFRRMDVSAFSPRGRSAIYAALPSREGVIGLVAVEHAEPNRYTERDRQIVESFARPAGLALDNSRLFSRLRSLGAQEERTRIARDLHDRVGQSLAYLAFELDRITRKAGGLAVEPDLASLRTDVRAVVSEVREALYDIRTDVSDEHDIVAVLESFLARVEQRSGLEVTFRHDAVDRLPGPQEREMWRIAQEALTNVERHARAEHVSVWWRCSPSYASLEVADDGQGFVPGVDRRIDSYGLVGMKERADGIGARLDIDSEPGRGTTVRCTIDRT